MDKSETTKLEKQLTVSEIKPIKIGKRSIGSGYKPLVIAEIGLNHGGNFDKAVQMIQAAAAQGCECVKFQCHIPTIEMIPSEAAKIFPANSSEQFFKVISDCTFTEKQEKKLKKITEENGMLYLCTPFCREAVDRLERMKVLAYKIGSGECNNHLLVEYIAKQKKPVILSTGMNDVKSARLAVDILNAYHIPFVVLHCTSMYPTPYNKVRLYAMKHLQYAFNCLIGLSDHTIDNYCALAAVARGASVVERHFTADKSWSGLDIPISMGPKELKDLLVGTAAIFEARNGVKTALQEERSTAAYAYASVVVTRPMYKNEFFTTENLWVKRPGTGQIHAVQYRDILGKRCTVDLKPDTFLKSSDVEGMDDKEE